MKFLNKLEIEIKIFLAALVFLVAGGTFFMNYYEREFAAVLRLGVNKGLVQYLQEEADDLTDSAAQIAAQALLERQMQWEAAAPFIVQTQKDSMRNIMFAIFGFVLLLMFLSMLYITSPLKKLAGGVEKIGRGEFAQIKAESGGALGVLERRIFQLQHELADLRRKERVAAIEKTWRDIAKMMAHEIKNPLTPMRLSIDKIDEKIMEKGQIPVEELQKFTRRMSGQIDNLEGLVNKFKSFSQKRTASYQATDIREFVENCAADMEDKIKTRVTGDAKLEIDRSFFDQILLNLYKNSINAGARLMEVSVKKGEDGKVRISFADDGKGVDKENLEIIFLPYITFGVNGSGIGLSVVKTLVESMNGRVWGENRRERGFCVIIELEGSKNGA